MLQGVNESPLSLSLSRSCEPLTWTARYYTATFLPIVSATLCPSAGAAVNTATVSMSPRFHPIRHARHAQHTTHTSLPFLPLHSPARARPCGKGSWRTVPLPLAVGVATNTFFRLQTQPLVPRFSAEKVFLHPRALSFPGG